MPNLNVQDTRDTLTSDQTGRAAFAFKFKRQLVKPPRRGPLGPDRPTMRQIREAVKNSETLPSLFHVVPWNYLWLSNKTPFKYRTWYWSHRGWTLLYTSKHRIDYEACKNHDVDPKSQPRGCIVGIVDLKDVRGERGLDDYELVPGKRLFFKNPIPYKPPQGAIRTFRVPISVVAKELKKIGIDPKTLVSR